MKNYPKEENREYVRKVLGYTITGDTKARIFLIGMDTVVMVKLKYLNY